MWLYHVIITSLLGVALLLPLVTGLLKSKRIMQVFGAKPEGGFWGVEVDVRREGRADLLDWSPLEAATINAAGAVYDPTSGYVALEGHDPHTLAYAPMCTSGTTRKPPEAVIANQTKFTQFTDSPGTSCVDCRASAFAFHGRDLYFLLIGNFGIGSDLVKKVQLRLMDSCARCRPEGSWDSASPEVFGTPLLFNCSHVVATVFTEIPEAGQVVTLKTGKQLKIVVEKSGGVSFFFQLFVGRRFNNKHDVTLNLYHVSPGADVTLLRQERVHSRYAQWDIQAMGSVDYRDGTLCWSAADRLYCGYYVTGGRISGEKMLLFPGEGASSGVCTGETLDLLHIITGVAIGETGDKTSVFFGCYPRWAGLGGAGLIRLYRNWSRKRVFPLKVNDERLIAGSIVVVPDTEVTCGLEDYKPEVCAELPGTPVLEDEPDLDGAPQTINENEAPYDVIDDDNDVTSKRNATVSNGSDVMTKERKSAADTIHSRIATTVIIIVAFLFPEGLSYYA